MSPLNNLPRLEEERGADVRRSALQLHGAAYVYAFPGRDDVIAGKKFVSESVRHGVECSLIEQTLCAQRGCIERVIVVLIALQHCVIVCRLIVEPLLIRCDGCGDGVHVCNPLLGLFLCVPGFDEIRLQFFSVGLSPSLSALLDNGTVNALNSVLLFRIFGYRLRLRRFLLTSRILRGSLTLQRRFNVIIHRHRSIFCEQFQPVNKVRWVFFLHNDLVFFVVQQIIKISRSRVHDGYDDVVHIVIVFPLLLCLLIRLELHRYQNRVVCSRLDHFKNRVYSAIRFHNGKSRVAHFAW